MIEAILEERIVLAEISDESGLDIIAEIVFLQGPKGADGANGGSTLEITITTPSDLWILQHNMNRFPTVTTVDSQGKEVHGGVTYVNSNRIDVQFGASFTGIAYVQ